MDRLITALPPQPRLPSSSHRINYVSAFETTRKDWHFFIWMDSSNYSGEIMEVKTILQLQMLAIEYSMSWASISLKRNIQTNVKSVFSIVEQVLSAGNTRWCDNCLVTTFHGVKLSFCSYPHICWESWDQPRHATDECRCLTMYRFDKQRCLW